MNAPGPEKKVCGFRIWEEGPMCERQASYKTVSEFFVGRESYFCTRHARIVEDLYEVKLVRI